MDSFSIHEELTGKHAVIDIGSNTLLLLVAKCNSGKIEIIDDIVEIARLGEGIAETGIIKNESIIRAEKILDSHSQVLKIHGVTHLSIIATAALREAKNGLEVKKKLEKIISSEILIIDSDTEAKLSYYGAFGTRAKGTLIDIGGGSTEFAYYLEEKLVTKSIPIGAVKIKEQFLHNDPATTQQITKAREHIKSLFIRYMLEPDVSNINAVAGTPVTLASIALGMDGYDFNKIHGYSFNINQLQDMVAQISKKSATELRDILKVHPHRSDIIVAGALILDEYLKYTQAQTLTVNCLGLRFGPLALPNFF